MGSVIGRTRGGLVLLLVLLAAQAACRGGRPGRHNRPEPENRERVARPADVYRKLGLIAGPESFPAVGGFTTLAGPADSSYVVFGLSLPNSALRFQRDGDGFAAEYVVTLTFRTDTVQVRKVERRERVRIPTFAETGRTEESVVFQALVPVRPGRYTVEIEARDGLGSRGLKLLDTLEVPAYGSGARRLSQPMLVYRAEGRSAPEAAPRFIVNPRATVPFGDMVPQVYVEGYGVPSGHPVQVRVRGEDGAELWQGRVGLIAGSDRLRYAVVEIPPAPLPLGRLTIELGDAGELRAAATVPMLVTISDQWMVANFEEVLDFLRYIADPAELDSLKAAPPPERRARWERFWSRRDPVPASPANEFREEFFERVRVATLQFGEPGIPGWHTDRGEVFIVLGPPDEVLDRQVGRADPSGPTQVQEWVYGNVAGGHLELTFLDRTGFGRFELTSGSESAFRAAARRLRPLVDDGGS